VQAFKLGSTTRPLFQIIKEDARSCIQDTAISAEAMLPGGIAWYAKNATTARQELIDALAG